MILQFFVIRIHFPFSAFSWVCTLASWRFCRLLLDIYRRKYKRFDLTFTASWPTPPELIDETHPRKTVRHQAGLHSAMCCPAKFTVDKNFKYKCTLILVHMLKLHHQQAHKRKARYFFCSLWQTTPMKIHGSSLRKIFMARTYARVRISAVFLAFQALWCQLGYSANVCTFKSIRRLRPLRVIYSRFARTNMRIVRNVHQDPETQIVALIITSLSRNING